MEGSSADLTTTTHTSPPGGQIWPNRDVSQRGQDNHLISVSANFDGSMLICETMNAEIWFWPTSSCKVGQSNMIVMKLKLDVSCSLSDVYTKFQIDISTHA